MLHKKVAQVLFNRMCAMSEPTAVHNKWLEIDFDYFPSPVLLCRTSQGQTLIGKNVNADVQLSAKYRGVLSMLTGECDADGLFFQRQFHYYGDTELGLALKSWLSDLSYRLIKTN